MVFPFYDIIRSVLETAPQVIYSPALGSRFLFFWLMALFVYSQYHKTARLQAQLYGEAHVNPVGHTIVAMVEGLVVGIIGSYLMTFFGVAFLPDGGGLIWVLGTALLLMLFSPRLMCFSYAGGLVSLSYLAFGFPQVSIPSLMGLVAILHLMESLLILSNGAAGATPVYLEKQGRPVGAFYLQRSWPVPVAILILAVISPAEVLNAGVEMPDWWPLIRTAPDLLAHPGAVFFLHALPAALGYGDLSLTAPPRLKTRKTALNLAFYSLVLLALAVGATRYPGLVWVAALFAPIGHELVVRFGSWREASRAPYFVPPAEGVMVLDVIPGSRADELGLGPGWVLRAVNGGPVSSRDQLEERLEAAAASGWLTLAVEAPVWDAGATKRSRSVRARIDRSARRRGSGVEATLPAGRLSCEFGPEERLGVIPVPEPGDPIALEFTSGSAVSRFIRGLLARSRN